MITRFDHAVIGVRDLAQARQVFAEGLGFEVYAGGRHTGLGTENAIIRFGLDYLELLGVYDEQEVAGAGLSRAALLEYLRTREGGPTGFALACDDLDELAVRFRTTGLEAVGPFDMQRLRPDGVLLRWRLLIPGGVSWRRPWPFFIQWEMDDRERLAHERPGSHPIGAHGVAGVSVVVHNLEAAVHLYSTQIGMELAADLDTRSNQAVYRVGDFTIDLVAPADGTPAADFLREQGEGLYQIFLRVQSVEEAQNVLAEREVALVDSGEPAAPWAIPASAALGAHLVLVGPA